MATVYTNADTVQWLHSGASAVGAVQWDAASCLGGNRSATELKALVGLYSYPVPQLAIEHIHGGNGTGTGTLTVTGASTVKYTGPSGTIGAEVTIANGETHVVEDTEPDMCVRISRDSATDLTVSEAMTLALAYPLNNAVGMDNITNAERAAGLNTYLGIFAYLPTTAVTTFKVWIKTQGTQRTTDGAQLGAAGSGTITTTGSFADWPTSGWAHIKTAGGITREIVYYASRTATSLTVPAAGRSRLGTSAAAGASDDTVDAVPGIRIAKEAPAAHVIQTIANDATAPAAVSWNYGTTSGTGLDIGALSGGDSYGLWIHRETPAGATAHADLLNSISVQFTSGGTVYDQSLYGVYCVADTALAVHEAYVGTDADPDMDAAPDQSGSLPLTVGTMPPGAGTKQYRFTVLRRNEYNIRGLSRYIRIIEIDSGGNEVTQAPSAPENITLTVAAGGEVDVTAVYYSDQDASPADYFRIYYDLGTDPVVGASLSVDVAVAADAYFFTPAYFLNYALGPFTLNADLRVLVRTYRSSDTTTSTNTTVSTTTVTTGPPTVVGYRDGFYGQVGYGQTFAGVTNTDTTYVDQPNNIYFINDAQGTSFYADTVLIWRWIWFTETLYIPNTWDVDGTATISGSGTSGLETISWTGGDKRIGLNVNGTRVLVIDVTNLTIEMLGTTGELAGSYPYNAPSYALVLEHVFNAWNAATFAMETYAHVDQDGVFSMDGTLENINYDQAAIEAL